MSSQKNYDSNMCYQFIAFDNVINNPVRNYLLCICLFENEKNEWKWKKKHFEKSSKLGGVAWM